MLCEADVCRGGAREMVDLRDGHTCADEGREDENTEKEDGSQEGRGRSVTLPFSLVSR